MHILWYSDSQGGVFSVPMADGDYSIADPYRFHFEIAWEVVNKGETHIERP